MKNNKPFDLDANLDAIDAFINSLFDNCDSQGINYANKEFYNFMKSRKQNDVDREAGGKLLSDYLIRKMEEAKLSSLHIGVEFHLWAFDEKGQVIPATETQLYPFTK